MMLKRSRVIYQTTFMCQIPNGAKTSLRISNAAKTSMCIKVNDTKYQMALKCPSKTYKISRIFLCLKSIVVYCSLVLC